MSKSTPEVLARMARIFHIYEEEVEELSEEILSEFSSEFKNLGKGDVGYKEAAKIKSLMRKYHSYLKKRKHGKAGRIFNKIKKYVKKLE